MSGEAQEAVQLLTVPFDWHLSLNTADELALLCVPHGKNMQVELLSVGVTLRVASTTAVVDLEWRDALRTEENDLSGTMATFFPSNVTTTPTTRAFDCNGATLATSADVLGTLINDLKAGLPLPEYTITNLTRALTYNTDGGSQTLLDDQIGQLINDIVDARIVDVVFSGGASTDRTFDADSTSIAELSDIARNLHNDLTPTADLVATVNIINQGLEGYIALWNGSRILNQGDALNLELDIGSGTDGEGAAAIVECRVLRHSGG